MYSSSKKDDDSVDQLLGSLSPIPDGSSELSSMDHFSIVTSQAVRTGHHICPVYYFMHAADTISSEERTSYETNSRAIHSSTQQQYGES